MFAFGIAAELQNIYHKFNKPLYPILVVGPQKSGKSSLI